MPNVNIDLDEEDYEDLRRFKEEHGLTWEGVLKYGIFN